MNLSTYWSFPELFAYRPTLAWPLHWWYVGMLAVLFLVLLVTLILRKKIAREYFTLITSFCTTNLFWGALLYFFRWQRVPLLGMDIWRLLQEIAMVVYLAVTIPAAVKAVRTSRVVAEKVSRKEKYLPKPKAK